MWRHFHRWFPWHPGSLGHGPCSLFTFSAPRSMTRDFRRGTCRCGWAAPKTIPPKNGQDGCFGRISYGRWVEDKFSGTTKFWHHIFLLIWFWAQLIWRFWVFWERWGIHLAGPLLGLDTLRRAEFRALGEKSFYGRAKPHISGSLALDRGQHGLELQNPYLVKLSNSI